jgi:ABC-2 type transport system permease protein
MSTKAITDPQHEHGPDEDQGRRPAPDELAPSLMSEDDPTVARFIGLAAASLVIVCGVFLAWNHFNPTKYQFPTSWLVLGLVLGLVGLLFHAAYDQDVQFRRLYLIFGGAAFILGAFLCLLPFEQVGGQFKSGFPCMALALVFTLAALRNEDDARLRNIFQLSIGAVGSALFLVGVVGGNIKGEFLLPYGLLLAILGLCYIAGFIALRGINDDLAYQGGWALGGVGALVFLIAFLRSLIPPLFYAWGWWGQTQPQSYLIPVGLLLMLIGLAAVAVSAGFCSDNRLAVLVRRELASFFYTPVAYLVLVGFTMITWIAFLIWFLALPSRSPEPVIGSFLLQWPGVLMMLFGIPVLTMRLVSEEKRSGTLEVLMTSPTDEPVVVLSKFLACLLIFLLMWVPFGLFILAFRIMGGAPFDYLPLLSFAVGLTVCGAGFVAAGLFFSSLARDQIVGAVLTFVFMMALTFVFLVPIILEQNSEHLPQWVKLDLIRAIVSHVSYIEVWMNGFKGKLMIAPLLFFSSMTVWFLFLTVKVLEARKWI